MDNWFALFARLGRAIRNRVWPEISTIGRMWGIRFHAMRDGLLPLPRGRFYACQGFWKDDLFLLRQSRRFGPVFKTSISAQFVTCIVDHQRSRAILNENVERLAAVDAPYNELVPGGFLRCQTGAMHRATRRIFARALQPELIENNITALREIVHRELSTFASTCEVRSPVNDEFLRTLDRIATTMLLLLFYGVRFGDAAFATLLNGYTLLGPKELVWEIGPAQKEAVTDLTATAHGLIADLRRSTAGRTRSVLLELVAGDMPIGKNIIGNLVYMVEMGRYDLYSLFHWLIKYISDNRAIIASIRTEERTTPGTVSLSAATVLETLRLNQSEAVVRKVRNNFTFDGWGIPKGTFLRACMREGHRDAAVFPEPSRFDPHRFIRRKYGPDEYSPFGFDHHHCIASELVIRLGSVLVEELVLGFCWQVLADGPAQRGPYGWEPSPAFAIRLMQRR
jgi:cytochrome P450